MAPRFCSYCGSAVPPQAAYCMSCGAPVQGAAGGPGPLPSGAPLPGGIPPPPPPPPSFSVATASPGPRRRWAVIVVIVVVAVLVVGAVLILAFPSASIQVTGINFLSPDNTCGLDGATDFGFNASAGDAVSFTYDLNGNYTGPGNGTSACEIHSVGTTTQGFSITRADVPLMVAANATQTLSYTVNCPQSNFDGALTVIIT